MPHVGTHWPYAWPLDFSLRYLYATFWALPVRQWLGTGGLIGTNARFNCAGEVSADFVYEPDEDRISWLWTNLTTIPAGLDFWMAFVLTHDEFFFKRVSEIRNGSTVIYRGTVEKGFYTPNLWLGPGVMAPVTPPTGGNMIGGFQIQPAPWSMFPDDYEPPKPPPP